MLSAFFARLRRQRQLRALDAQLDRALQARKADRAVAQERARRGARTKARQAFERDRLRNEQVTF